MKKVEVASHPEQLTLAVHLDALQSLREFVFRQSQRVGLSPEREARLTLAAVEVMTNIIRHAKGIPSDGAIQVTSECKTLGLVLRLSYPGQAYTPPKQVLLADMNKYPEGGFGHYIIENACDVVDYSHHQGINTIRLEMSV